jgi:hypothetical protein
MRKRDCLGFPVWSNHVPALHDMPGGWSNASAQALDYAIPRTGGNRLATGLGKPPYSNG